MRLVTEDLAPESAITSNLLQEIYRLRLAVKTYVKTGSAEAATDFSNQSSKAHEMIAKAKAHISFPERIKFINQIGEHQVEYVDIFNRKIIVNQQNRERLVSGTLDIKGPEVEKILSQIMQSSFNDGDVRGAFYAGKTLRELL
ncbi:hypothetical protein [Shewanella baltica]|nr:hypothetical protein [Shewanella baltica]